MINKFWSANAGNSLSFRYLGESCFKIKYLFLIMTKPKASVKTTKSHSFN
jgi:hypothetical protein